MPVASPPLSNSPLTQISASQNSNSKRAIDEVSCKSDPHFPERLGSPMPSIDFVRRKKDHMNFSLSDTVVPKPRRKEQISSHRIHAQKCRYAGLAPSVWGKWWFYLATLMLVQCQCSLPSLAASGLVMRRSCFQRSETTITRQWQARLRERYVRSSRNDCSL